MNEESVKLKRKLTIETQVHSEHTEAEATTGTQTFFFSEVKKSITVFPFFSKSQLYKKRLHKKRDKKRSRFSFSSFEKKKSF
jgi:hypothetical protein